MILFHDALMAFSWVVQHGISGLSIIGIASVNARIYVWQSAV
jgi:hypothetical protein